MNKITKEQVIELAVLARLDLSPIEIEEYQADLESILDYVSKIQELKTDKVVPFSDGSDLRAKLRSDSPKNFKSDYDLLSPDKLKRGLLNTKGVFKRDA